MGCGWSCGETVVGWLGLVVHVGRCDWSMLILAVGWLLADDVVERSDGGEEHFDGGLGPEAAGLGGAGLASIQGC